MKSGVGGWQISWAAVMVHTRLKSLKEPADRIQAFIKEYTDTDSIFKGVEKMASNVIPWNRDQPAEQADLGPAGTTNQ